MSDQTNAITRAKSAVALALLILGDACVETAQGEAPLDDSAMLPPKVGPDKNKSILRSPTTKQEPEFTCLFCGAPSYVDPSDQTPPPDYCHESDHGEPDTPLPELSAEFVSPSHTTPACYEEIFADYRQSLRGCHEISNVRIDFPKLDEAVTKNDFLDRTGCHRSHPHENMSPECISTTERVRKAFGIDPAGILEEVIEDCKNGYKGEA